jgi:hypothetical protein
VIDQRARSGMPVCDPTDTARTVGLQHECSCMNINAFGRIFGSSAPLAMVLPTLDASSRAVNQPILLLHDCVSGLRNSGSAKEALMEA